MAKGKKVRRIGRPSRADLGLKPSKGVYTKIDEEVLAVIIAKYGSVNQALLYAAGRSAN
jgi:hypothetical protein